MPLPPTSPYAPGRPADQADPRRRWLAPCLILACLSASPATAETSDDGDWQVSLGAGAIYAPDYEGSDDYEVMPFPAISVEYRGIVYIRGAEIGANLLRLEPTDELQIKFGPVARYRRDRKEKRNRDLRGLGNVDTAVELGGALSIEYQNSWARVTLAKDVAGGHEGLVGTGEAGLRFDLSDSLGASASASVGWADKDYMASYFGVTAAQAAASGLPVYRAGAGFKDAGAGLSLDYRLGDHWTITAAGGYTRLFGDAADAPLVARRGSRDQWNGGLFLSYRF